MSSSRPESGGVDSCVMRGWIWPPAVRGRFGWCCRRFATDSAADKFGQITCFFFFWPPSLLANCFNMQTVLLFFLTSTPPVSVCNTCWFVPVLFFSGSGTDVANPALWRFCLCGQMILLASFKTCWAQQCIHMNQIVPCNERHAPDVLRHDITVESDDTTPAGAVLLFLFFLAGHVNSRDSCWSLTYHNLT